MQGLEYFESIWNWLDMSEFTLFLMFFVSMHNFTDQFYEYIPEIKYIVITLSFLKIIFFSRMIESLGFILRMIFICIKELIPFIICFFLFLILFTLLLIVLNNDIDEEVDPVEYLGFFGKALLQTFRTSIGELGTPRYPSIYDTKKKVGIPTTFPVELNIYLIWITWYT